MDQIVAANRLEFWIGEKGERVFGLLKHVQAGLLGRIDTDAHDTDSGLIELTQILFKTSQLEVTIPSPVAAIKN